MHAHLVGCRLPWLCVSCGGRLPSSHPATAASGARSDGPDALRLPGQRISLLLLSCRVAAAHLVNGGVGGEGNLDVLHRRLAEVAHGAALQRERRHKGSAPRHSSRRVRRVTEHRTKARAPRAQWCARCRGYTYMGDSPKPGPPTPWLTRMPAAWALADSSLAHAAAPSLTFASAAAAAAVCLCGSCTRPGRSACGGQRAAMRGCRAHDERVCGACTRPGRGACANRSGSGCARLVCLRAAADTLPPRRGCSAESDARIDGPQRR